MPSYEPVTALLRGLTVLEAVAEQKNATIKSLYQRTGIPKATLVRLLETLIAAGYIYSAEQQTCYRLTARPLSLSSQIDVIGRLTTVAAPFLDEFQNAFRWPSDIGVFDRDAMVIVGTNRKPGTLGVNRQAGSRVSAVRTALGRAFIAFMEPDKQLPALRQLQELTQDPEDLARHQQMLEEVRTQGFAVSDQENLADIRAVAAPIFYRGNVVASVNLITLAVAVTSKELVETFGHEVVSLAKKISSAIERDNKDIYS